MAKFIEEEIERLLPAGMSRLSAYEIFGNPDDIVAASGEKADLKTGKFCGFITRGPGHNYKIIISTAPIFDTEEAAKEHMQKVIEAAKQWAEKDIENPPEALKWLFAKEPAN